MDDIHNSINLNDSSGSDMEKELIESKQQPNLTLNKRMSNKGSEVTTCGEEVTAR